MQQKSILRFLSLALALILVCSVIPQHAQAALDLSSFKAFKKQATTVAGTWSDTEFWRTNRYTYPFEFNSALTSCTGFTMDYEIVEVEKGNLLSGQFKFEIYVRTSAGKWKSVKTFYLKDYETTVEVSFKEPMTIDAVAVICGMKGEYNYTHDITVYNPTYLDGNDMDSTTNNNSFSSTTRTASKKLSGTWSEDRLTRNGRSANYFELSSTLKRCTGFTMNYQLTEVSSGSMDGNYRFAVYVRSTSGKWKYVDSFKRDGFDMTYKVTMDPLSIDAIAVLCLRTGNYTYSYNFTITDPITR